MSSSAAPSSLSRILIGSLIGAVIGLILLALGVAILWNAADQRMASPPPPPPPSQSAPSKPSSEAAASPVPYPTVAPGVASVPVAAEPEAPPRAATSIWRSIFDDEEERAAAPASEPAPAAAPRPEARPAPSRPAAPRPSTPRRPPEAQRQDDSLFF